MSGRISIDNLSDSLKELINQAGITEEQVINLINANGLTEEQVINLIKNNLTGDLTQLSTTNKTNIVAAINELFQSANNGKELIANAIGEPLSSNDTFSAMSTDINNLLSTFKTNMMNNGVTVESGDKFKSLIDKIATMVEEGSGKGIQFASGIHNMSGSNNDFVITNLTFKPDIILVDYYPSITLHHIHMYNRFIDEDNYFILGNWNGSSMYYRRALSDTYYINETGFCLTGMSLPLNKDINWYAIGVGEEDTTLRDSLASILQEEGVSVTEEDDMASLISKVDEEFSDKNANMNYYPTWYIPHDNYILAADMMYNNSTTLGRAYHTISSVGNYIYAIGGWTSSSSSNATYLVSRFNVLNNTWDLMSNAPSTMNDHTASVIDDKIYIIDSSNAYCYNPSNDSWSTITNVPTNRYHHSEAVVNGRMYILCGYPSSGGGSALKSVYSYDPTTSSWTAETDMLYVRYKHSSSAVGDKIYLMCGGASPTKDNYCYDTLTKTWSTKTAPPSARNEHTSSTVDGKIYLIGGTETSFGTSTNYCYDPVTNTWSTQKECATSIYCHAATVSENVIYCIGCLNPGGASSNINICYIP